MAKYTPTNNKRKPTKGAKASRKVLKLKKGTRGEATKFITRSKAIRKLGLSLKDFRRVCILKGIYPREPNKKLEGSHKTYYHKKDIIYLAHDDMIQALRQQTVVARKVKKALKENNNRKVKNLKKMRPEIVLNKIVRERYPTFEDAIRDLEDPLNLINTFASIPSHRAFKVPPVVTNEAAKVKHFFNNFVIKSGCLQKVFLSIKGIYFECNIQGNPVLWLEPYPLSQTLPYNVDYKVMLTFLEFYLTMLKFVLFKLYRGLNLVYPPRMVETVDIFTYRDIVADLVVKADEVAEEKYQMSEEFANQDIVKKIMEKKGVDSKNGTQGRLLSGLTFFLSNEVFREPFEFMIMALGGEVIYSEENFLSEEFKNANITHVITERAGVKGSAKRDVVQPQWVCDSINAGKLLPTGDYAVGRALPPHISPFKEDTADAAVIFGKKGMDIQEIQKAQNGADQDDEDEDSEGDERADEDSEGDDEEGEEEDDVLEETFEIEKEQKKAKKAATNAKNEKVELAAAMLSKKKQKIRAQLQKNIKEKELRDD